MAGGNGMNIGVDPGKSGAVAFLRDDGGLYWLKDMDVVDDVIDEIQTLKQQGNALFACLEKQGTRPFEARGRVLTTGIGEGIWRGIFLALGVSYELVSPARWHNKIVGRGKGTAKQRTFECARRRWPEAELVGPRGGKKDGRADALCIAEYARRLAFLPPRCGRRRRE